MKLFLHFAVVGFSNTYLIGPEKGGDAILIDPAVMNIDLLKLIEKNNFYIRHILITHNHSSHTAGIRTLSKIYDFDVYTARPSVIDGHSHQLVDIQELTLNGFEVTPISIEVDALDTYIFQIRNMLFTGDVLAAGTLGHAPNLQSRVLMLQKIREKVCGMDGNPLILPGHGPPTTLEAELQFNPYFNGQIEKSGNGFK